MITIGADPELFLRDKGGKFISAIGKFGGTKQNPRPLSSLGAGFFVQEDNVAVEFNVPPVEITNSKDFIGNIHKSLTELQNQANLRQLDLALVASAEFSPDQLRHPRARRFGCDPDFNVWTLDPNPYPNCKNKHLRSAGGHIHLGGEFDRIAVGRALDLFVGCPSLIYDKDTRRRELYGKAGAIRMKPYGIEYRTLSNAWLKDVQIMNLLLMQIRQALNFVEKVGQIQPGDEQRIMKCINESDINVLSDLQNCYKLTISK